MFRSTKNGFCLIHVESCRSPLSSLLTYRAVGEMLTVITFRGGWFLLGRPRGSVFLISHSNILSFFFFLSYVALLCLKSAENFGSCFMRCMVYKIWIQVKDSLRPSNTICLSCIFPIFVFSNEWKLLFPR